MPIITTQRRARELGRIRLGDKGSKGQPQKLNRFRLTSQAKELLDTAARLYGGTVQEWTPRGGAPQWELYTEARRIPIIVPPQPVSQWLEYWTAGGCVHRCDGETNMLTGEPCDLEEEISVRVRGNDVEVNPHTEAKPTTRLKVILRDVEGVGVWRLESHGWNAAVELPDAAEFLAQAGGYIEGHLALEERITKSDGQTNRFVVPIIEINVTPAQLFAGQGRIVPAIGGGPVPQIAPEADAPAALTAPQGPGDPILPGVDDIAAAADMATLTVMRHELIAANALTDELAAATVARRDQLIAAETPTEHERDALETGDGAAIAEIHDADVVEDQADDPVEADRLWQRIVATAGALTPPLTLSQVQVDFLKVTGITPANASVSVLDAYLGHITPTGDNA